MAIKIYIDQGHNPVNPNAGSEGNGLREQDIVYRIGQLLAERLRADGRFAVRLSRPTASTQLGTSNATSLAARVNDANSWGADYFVSLHTNASDNSAVSGTETLAYSRDTRGYGLAQAIQKNVVAVTGLPDRGVKLRPGLYVLRKTRMPAVLAELGFITNPGDAALLSAGAVCGRLIPRYPVLPARTPLYPPGGRLSTAARRFQPCHAYPASPRHTFQGTPDRSGNIRRQGALLMTQRKTADTRMDSRISPAVWAGGGIALAAALFTRLRVGSPLPLLHLLNADSILPPLWLTGLCWLSSFFLSGCAAGFILNCRTGGCAAAWRLRGAVYGLLCLFAGLGWYPLLFAAQALWLSWLCLLAAALSGILCLACWVRVRRRVLLFLLPAAVWMCCLTVLQLVVLLRR